MKIPLLHRIYRKFVYTSHLWPILPVAEHLTVWEKNKLDFNKISEIEGWLTTKEAIVLFRNAARLQKKSTILEIGTWKGKSTYVLSCGIGTKGKVITIDPFDGTATYDKVNEKSYLKEKGKTPVFDQFRTKMQKFGVWKRIKALKGYSHEFVNDIPTVDFIFIDGDHTKKGVEFDFLNFSPYLRKGGFLAFHDYMPERKTFGVTQAINAHVKENKAYKFIGLYDSIWVSQKFI